MWDMWRLGKEPEFPPGLTARTLVSTSRAVGLGLAKCGCVRRCEADSPARTSSVCGNPREACVPSSTDQPSVCLFYSKFSTSTFPILSFSPHFFFYLKSTVVHSCCDKSNNGSVRGQARLAVLPVTQTGVFGVSLLSV